MLENVFSSRSDIHINEDYNLRGGAYTFKYLSAGEVHFYEHHKEGTHDIHMIKGSPTLRYKE